jgi:hypothetical protein
MTLTEKRKAKYPDTTTFHYHNANPKNKITTDCVIRALATGMQKPYDEVVMELAVMQCETGYDDGDPVMIDRYLKKNGWIKCKQPRKEDNTKYTGKEFCLKLQHPIYSEELDTLPDDFDWHHMIANIGGHHIVAIVEGMVYDIWNSTHKCIGNVWVKRN